MAKDMQRAIIRVGISLLERKEIKVSTYFRYAILENDYLSDFKLFQFPLALQKLGLFIMDAYKNYQQKKRKDKPLVMSVKNSKKGYTLVVAVLGNHMRDDSTSRNDFGQRFQIAVEKIGCKGVHSSFETSLIEVKNEEWRPFIEELNTLN